MNTTHLAIAFFVFFVAAPLAQAQTCYVSVTSAAGTTQCKNPPFFTRIELIGDPTCNFTICQGEIRNGVLGESFTLYTRDLNSIPKPLKYVELKQYNDDTCTSLAAIQYLETAPCNNASNFYATCDQGEARVRSYGSDGCNSYPMRDNTYPLGKCTIGPDRYVIASCYVAEPITPATSKAMVWSAALYLQALFVILAAICIV